MNEQSAYKIGENRFNSNGFLFELHISSLFFFYLFVCFLFFAIQENNRFEGKEKKRRAKKFMIKSINFSFDLI